MIVRKVHRNFFDFTCEAQPLGKLSHGWSDPEMSGIWSLGMKSVLSLPIQSNMVDTVIKITISPFLHENLLKFQKIYIISADNLLVEIDLLFQKTIDIRISAELINIENNVIIELWHPYAASPKSVNISNDIRRLSICLHTIEILSTIKYNDLVSQLIIMDGDSITKGVSLSFISTFIDQLNIRSVINDISVSGETLIKRNNSFATYSLTQKFNNQQKGIIHLAAGSNDIRLSNDIKQTIIDMKIALKEYCLYAKNLGFRIILGTILPRQDLTEDKEQARKDYNIYIRSIATILADGLSDWALDIEMGSDQFPTNPILCLDGIHPTRIGYEILAKITYNTISLI